jgi:bidirectional [NiFe] hydrogenase diaphorase subunit
MTLEELEKITAAEKEKERQFQHHVRVCVAAGCLSSHSDQIKDGLEQEVKRRGLTHECQIKGVCCLGLCAEGPLVSVDGGDILYRSPAVDRRNHCKIGDRQSNGYGCRLAPFFAAQVMLENSGHDHASKSKNISQ